MAKKMSNSAPSNWEAWEARRKEEVQILIGMYRDLEKKYKEAGLRTQYLEVTAGAELFGEAEPALGYCLARLADAESDYYRWKAKQSQK